MLKSCQFNLLAAAIAALFLSGCGDTKSTFIEKGTAEKTDDKHGHGDDGYTIESKGRLAVLTADKANISIFNLDDGDLLDSFALTHSSNALKASAGYRYAVITSRNQDYVGFIDGGLWREDHVEHIHDYSEAPVMSGYELAGSAPTHVIKHDGQMAIFYDGNASTGTSASVQVITDLDITNAAAELPRLDYDINMHGAAEPRGEHLLATIRRDDNDSTSANKILPDQVGVYHRHDNEYELEQVFEVTCPNLHGATQNHEYVAFGCSDGVLIAHQHDDIYEAEKVANIEALNNLRIGTLYGHEEQQAFIGIASGHGSGQAVLVTVNPHEKQMEALDWQPLASPVAYSFSYSGEHFLVLDTQGFLNILSAHEHDGHQHWELEGQIDISEKEVTEMPEGMRFSMTVAQNGHYVYVADPITQQVHQVDLESKTISSSIELNAAPSAITWLGIAEQEHEHSHH
ncbi:5-methyltetrahydrofolate--homocysteine methyltransferase [Pseudoalteromonas sp. T1lg65]|uniref:5-methyltetrahydrofolate--homocysteine methyltransferase n=1 Tax=Pseudoalteromonas sp. T1lg65 TaxID=2077101 RepID=UPI003F78CC21